MKEPLLCLSLPDQKPCPIPARSILCLGNFDGVHLGHRSLFAAAKEIQKSFDSHIPCGVFCFRGLTSDLLLKTPPGHLDSEEDRMRKFADCGMEFVIFADFARIRDLSPVDFLQSILIDTCHATALVCGENYRFGKSGMGRPELLKSDTSLIVKILPEFALDGDVVSSTRIRKLLEQDGNAKEATRLLGEPYALTSPVEHGKGLGHKLGVPTLNQFFPAHALIPRHGVYITTVLVDGTIYPAVSNVGVRPSVEKTSQVNCETNLLSYCGSLYEKTVSTRFLEWIRPEEAFESEKALQKAISEDLERAKAYFKITS
ncbi:MAG: riboflavin biosynthesis protein RibF [Clostridia bacterium]|nr:riboflavin biosynthesis protein RibF [Clostridia bacterium]